jgi:recombinational DNA repair protein RecT
VGKTKYKETETVDRFAVGEQVYRRVKGTRTFFYPEKFEVMAIKTIRKKRVFAVLGLETDKMVMVTSDEIENCWDVDEEKDLVKEN